jgi:hypothetical protein
MPADAKARTVFRPITLVTCIWQWPPEDNAYLTGRNDSAHSSRGTASMIGLSTTEVVIALAALVIVLLVLAKLFPGKPKRAEKWEKAEIVKQLLALSEQENGSRLPAPAVRPTSRSSQPRLKTTGKATLPARAKAR